MTPDTAAPRPDALDLPDRDVFRVRRQVRAVCEKHGLPLADSYNGVVAVQARAFAQDMAHALETV
jgi:hypothetical protein